MPFRRQKCALHKVALVCSSGKVTTSMNNMAFYLEAGVLPLRQGIMRIRLAQTCRMASLFLAEKCWHVANFLLIQVIFFWEITLSKTRQGLQ
jgi:hypothetical protein